MEKHGSDDTQTQVLDLDLLQVLIEDLDQHLAGSGPGLAFILSWSRTSLHFLCLIVFVCLWTGISVESE